MTQIGENAGSTAPPSLISRVAPLLRQWEGPLTEDLLRTPGKFGLGQVPLDLAPDATTTMVCGFCSTGCGLNVHLQNGEAVNLTPDSTYPVNLGMACPKGWEALTVLDAPDRATTPLARDARGRLRPDRLGRGAATLLRALQRHPAASTAPRRSRFSSTGQIADRGNGLLGQPRQVRHGHAARRRQHAAVHGHLRRRLQASVRLRRTALHVRRISKSRT